MAGTAGGTIWTGDGTVIRAGVVFDEGRIEGVAQGAAPRGAREVSARGRYVPTGLVDAHSHLGVHDAMALRAPAGDKAALGEKPKGYGRQGKAAMTRVGRAARLHEGLQVRAFTDKVERARDGPTKGPKPDARSATLAMVVRGGIPLRIHCHRTDGILTGLRVREEFDRDITLEHVTEGYMVAGEIAGVSWSASVAVREQEALRAVRLNPARGIGAGERIGSLSAGKQADVAVWQGHPFDIRSRGRRRCGAGELVHQP